MQKILKAFNADTTFIKQNLLGLQRMEGLSVENTYRFFEKYKDYYKFYRLDNI